MSLKAQSRGYGCQQVQAESNVGLIQGNELKRQQEGTAFNEIMKLWLVTVTASNNIYNKNESVIVSIGQDVSIMMGFSLPNSLTKKYVEFFS